VRTLAAAAAVSLTLACASAQTSVQAPPPFDGTRALSHLEKIVAIGPRPAGSPGAEATRQYIKQQLAATGLTATEQAFDAQTPAGTLRMVNVSAVIPGPGTGRLIIAGHYDTKLYHDITFVGANDGGSSAAFLIELARALQGTRHTLPIELVFFDGEEAVVEWQGTDNTYGSRHYVAQADRDGTLKDIGALILVDMIGEHDVRLLRDTNSTPWLVDIFWSTARRMNRPEFSSQEMVINDDHLPFLHAGIPAIDLIDLNYPAWHTEGDTMDKVSASSLQAVGDVLLAALPDVIARVKTAR
jgi:Zn-dependent M28 family amino/carboxypeptidase